MARLLDEKMGLLGCPAPRRPDLACPKREWANYRAVVEPRQQAVEAEEFCKKAWSFVRSRIEDIKPLSSHFLIALKRLDKSQ
jgi:hypothetical protein